MRHLGQSTVEYALFTAVVAAALIAMQVYVRRSIQANLKGLEDQINVEAIEGAGIGGGTSAGTSVGAGTGRGLPTLPTGNLSGGAGLKQEERVNTGAEVQPGAAGGQQPLNGGRSSR